MAGRDLPQLIHKSGPLKQSNKSHKHGRHRTKGQLDGINRGKVSIKAISKKTKASGKTVRRLQAMQHRKSKKASLMEKRRGLGKDHSPPHVIAIVSLSPSCLPSMAAELLRESDESQIKVTNTFGTTLISKKHRQRFTLLLAESDNLLSVLNAGKVADTILFLTSADNTMHPSSPQIISCLLAQCLPNVTLAMQGLESVPEKKKAFAKKSCVKSFEKWFSDTKMYPLDSAQDANLLLRHIANQKQRSVFYRENRPYLLADKLEFTPNADEPDVGTLKVSGYVRGRTLDVNRLVYVPGFGEFQLKQIDAPEDPCSINQLKIKKRNLGSTQDVAMDDEEDDVMDEDVKVIAVADPASQTSLEFEAVPDVMEQEQTWPDDSELKEAEERINSAAVNVKKKRVPKGTSDYQSSWIVESEDESDEDSGEEDIDIDDEDHANLMQSEEESESEVSEEDDFDTISVSTNMPDEKYDQTMDLDEDKRVLEKYRAERENEMFPDEIDTPSDVPARVRFQRYRGLKSFRTSPWDVNENLPLDYSRIFRFADFARTKKKVYNEEEGEGAMPGWYVTVHVKNVPKTVSETSNHNFVIYGLLNHEHKMTVMHFVIKRHQSFTSPLKSKDPVIFRVGYRTFRSCPIFSQHTTGNKFKFERFLPKDGVVVATVYAPVMFPPAPVQMFTVDDELIATGTVYKSDPSRVILKKIVLSGHPYKINKKSVVLRHMFFSRDDILWFKPVELYTKFGRHGHIKEPLGTHGHMKCVFDGQLKAQDTACLSLYKRIFPKWTYQPILKDQDTPCEQQ